MPKIVDHASRRAEIGWAVARLIESDGVQAVSVRAVAEISGYRPSTLRHYFPNSDEMFTHALVVVRQRQQARLGAKNWPGDSKGALREAWLEALPVDMERRTETHVWLAASIAAHSDEARRVLAHINVDLTRLCDSTVQVFNSERHLPTASLALRAFTDGLALGAIAEPDRFTPAVIERSLADYLNELEAPQDS